MKTLLFALATLTAGVGSAHAELFSPSVLPGAIIGGIAGGVIGNNSGGHHGGDGAIIGAIAGGVIGAAVDSDRRDTRYYDSRSYDNREYPDQCAPTVVYSQPPVYREAPRTRVVYVQPAPRVVYVEPRREVIVRHEDRRDYYGRGRSYDRYQHDNHYRR